METINLSKIIIHPESEAENKFFPAVLKQHQEVSAILDYFITLTSLKYCRDRNFIKINNFLAEKENPSTFSSLLKGDNVENELSLSMEMMRLLHNFLMANYSYIYISRARRKKVLRNFFPDLHKEIMDEIYSKFGKFVPGKFINDLRNFSTHKLLPLTFVNLTLTNAGFGSLKSGIKFVLSTPTLKTWKKWSEYGRMALAYSRNDKLDFMPYLEQYNKRVREFDEWEVKTIFDNCSEYFDSVNNDLKILRAQLNGET